ncbi:nucleotidyltransferase family protein [Lonepinella sp. BR2882]|uniref:nucleotidyltransferase family protein n=1 Tax=Lonepinella sp. BR2882 TaxID=3095283 RepID=UPI003F6DEA02
MIDLSEENLAIVKCILREYVPDLPVWVFGSRIKGTAKKYSDLDLAVITQQPMSIRLQADIEEAFSESDLPIFVDVIDWASCSENFKRIILQQYEVLQTGI